MQRQPSRLCGQQFDLLVIGGGIYGAWIAYDAALRGLHVALVEGDDWASATSSSSSKLIHGGLRYLEYGHLGLVAKTLRERERLLRLGPHRIWPLDFMLPLSADGRAGRTTLALGLSCYDFLAGRWSRGHRYWSRSAINQYTPWLATPAVQGAYVYSDASTDDARLTLEIVAGAVTAGAIACNHVRVERLLQTGDKRVCGAVATDTLTGSSFEIDTQLTVVASGAMAREVSGIRDLPVRFSKGVHLVMPPLPTTEQRAVLLTAPQDRRVCFLIPWYGATLVGTTDTDYHDATDSVRVDESDIDYLLTVVRYRCPYLGWERSQVRGAFAGLRTLVSNSTQSVGSVSREWGYRVADGLLVSLGGKLTSARQDASDLVDVCFSRLGKQLQRSITGKRRLPWAPPGAFALWIRKQINEGLAVGLDREVAVNVAHRYGIHCDRLINLLRIHREWATRIDQRYPFCLAEIPFVLASEQAFTVHDVFRRRIPLLVLGTTAAALRHAVHRVGEHPSVADLARDLERFSDQDLSHFRSTI